MYGVNQTVQAYNPVAVGHVDGVRVLAGGRLQVAVEGKARVRPIGSQAV